MMTIISQALCSFVLILGCAGCAEYTASARWNERLARAKLGTLKASTEAVRIQPICVRYEADLRQSYLDLAVDTQKELTAFSTITQLDASFKLATRVSDGRGMNKLAWYSGSFGSGNRDHYVSLKSLGIIANTGRYGYVFEYPIERRSWLEGDEVTIEYDPDWTGSLFPSGTVRVPVINTGKRQRK